MIRHSDRHIPPKYQIIVREDFAIGERVEMAPCQTRGKDIKIPLDSSILSCTSSTKPSTRWVTGKRFAQGTKDTLEIRSKLSTTRKMPELHETLPTAIVIIIAIERSLNVKSG